MLSSYFVTSLGSYFCLIGCTTPCLDNEIASALCTDNWSIMHFGKPNNFTIRFGLILEIQNNEYKNVAVTNDTQIKTNG